MRIRHSLLNRRRSSSERRKSRAAGAPVGSQRHDPAVHRAILRTQQRHVDLWIENVAMDEVERLKRKAEDPDKDRWSRQYVIMQVFDQLIANTDRNQTNI